MLRFSPRLAVLVSSVALSFSASPASSVERLVLRMPFLETSITITIDDDAQTAGQMIRSSPDLADLQTASGGQLLALLEKVFLAPLPIETKAFLEGSTGQPLLEQALLAAASLVELEGVELDSSGRMLTDALIRADRNGQANVLGFLREMPGEQATVDLSRVVSVTNRLIANLTEGIALAQSTQAASVTPALQAPLQPSWTRSELRIDVDHRSEQLRLLVLQPKAARNGRLAVISHGLWDDPESFEGWGEVLVSAGYTVFMPDHPGSDFNQQQSMLAGDQPPPGPEELRLRPMDVSALLNAIDQGRLLAGQPLNTESIAVIGHSWGGTTSLQLAGAVPTDQKLRARCADQNHSERNISWVLQCSWLSGIHQAGLSDPRVGAVVAVSPPLRLLFDPVSSRSLQAKVLLVSGTRDWVVPSGPEAVVPMRSSVALQAGHRLVLVEGADHFSLRSFRNEARPAVVGPLLLAWLNEQLDVPGAVTFTGGGWGDETVRLVDVSNKL